MRSVLHFYRFRWRFLLYLILVQYVVFFWFLTRDFFLPSSTSLKNNSIPMTAPDTPKVIILAASYVRTGSSFLAELLVSAGDGKSVYFFEPFRRNEDLDKREVVGALLSCDAKQIKRLYPKAKDKAFIMKSPSYGLFHDNVTAWSEECKSRKLKVIKTVRATPQELFEAYDGLEDNAIIVSLFRDPRAIVNSMLKFPDEWPIRLRQNSTSVCVRIQKHWEEAKHIPDIQIVHYEDIVSNLWQEGRELFRRLQLSWECSTARLMYDRTKVPPASAEDWNRCGLVMTNKGRKYGDEDTRQYYGTRRYWPQWRTHAWMKTLPKNITKLISEECAPLLQALGYKH